MDSVKSFFANPNKESNLANQQNGVSGRWTTWNRNMQGHSDPGSVNASIRDTNRSDAKRKDSDNYFYIIYILAAKSTRCCAKSPYIEYAGRVIPKNKLNRAVAVYKVRDSVLQLQQSQLAIEKDYLQRCGGLEHILNSWQDYIPTEIEAN